MGPVVLRRFVEICPDDFNGIINVCPCANPFALELDYEIYPENEDLGKLKSYYYSRFNHNYSPFGFDRNNCYNMNILWHRRGEAGLGVAGDIITWLWETICEPANMIIDFHCRNGDAPLIYAHETAFNCASYFGIQGIFLLDVAGALWSHSNRGRRRAFCVEFSVQHGYKRAEFSLGINGILNVMRGIGMLPGPVRLKRPVYMISGKASMVVKAEAAGHLIYHRAPYDKVHSGDLLFDVRGLEGFDVLHRGMAPADGVMGEPTFRPLAERGMPVCAVHRPEISLSSGQELEKLAF